MGVRGKTFDILDLSKLSVPKQKATRLLVASPSFRRRVAFVNSSVGAPSVSTISLQKWVGKVWQGQWEHQTDLPVPSGRIARVAADDVDDEDEDET